jgi:hypothetical protein
VYFAAISSREGEAKSKISGKEDKNSTSFWVEIKLKK